jgi:magnesium-transporting ATPase (P-type)
LFFLLQGCTLRNTRWIIGQVIFTGRETKLMLNNKAIVYKRSMVESTVDTALYVIFGIQFLICCFGCGANYFWMNNNLGSSWYLPPVTNISQTAGLSWFTYLLLLDILGACLWFGLFDFEISFFLLPTLTRLIS